MSDTHKPEDQQSSFSSDHGGLRAAAAEVQTTREENLPVEVVPADDIPDRSNIITGDNEGISVRRAADGLASWREERAQERKAFEVAIYGEGDAPTEVEARPAEVEQDPVVTSVPSDGDSAVSAVAVHGAHEIRQASHHERAATQRLLIASLVQNFPEVQSHADLARLAVENPARHAAAIEFIQNAQQIDHSVAQQAQRTEIAWLHNHETWGAEQDRAFVEANPEMKDQKIAAELSQHAHALFKQAGFSEQDVSRAWHGLGGIPLRHAGVQSIALKAAKYDLAQERMRAMREGREGHVRKSVPPVQRPGVAGSHHSSAEAAIQKASAAMRTNPTPRNAAELLIAQRKAAARR